MVLKKPKVSICLPTLNARKFLEPRMDSIMSQSFSDWELIVCDSYSDDGTWSFLQKFKDDPRVRLYQVPKEGLYAGWNECLERAEGEYVYIATADDTCKSDFLENMVEALENSDHVVESDGYIGKTDVAVCAWDFIDEQGSVVAPPHRTPDEYFGETLKAKHVRSYHLEFLVHVFLGTSWTTITSVVFRRKLLDTVGFFRTDCGAFADRFWGLRLVLESDVVYLPDRLATWRHHENQRSAETGRKMQKILYDIFASEVAELEDRLPSEWRDNVGWKREFLQRIRNEYLQSYHLDRRSLKNCMAKCLRGCFLALFYEPKYAFDRLLHGFAWSDEYHGDDRVRLELFVSRNGVRKPIVLEKDEVPA